MNRFLVSALISLVVLLGFLGQECHGKPPGRPHPPESGNNGKPGIDDKPGENSQTLPAEVGVGDISLSDTAVDTEDDDDSQTEIEVESENPENSENSSNNGDGGEAGEIEPLTEDPTGEGSVESIDSENSNNGDDGDDPTTEEPTDEGDVESIDSENPEQTESIDTENNETQPIILDPINENTIDKEELPEDTGNNGEVIVDPEFEETELLKSRSLNPEEFVF